MICYETDRLRVRHLTTDDLDDLARLCADPLAMQYMGDGSVLSREQCAGWIDICQTKYAERGYGTSAVVDKATGDFVGFCGVVQAPDHDFDEIIYALDQAHWGKGYATEAARAMLAYVFEVSALETIYATIHEANTASQAMMTRLGMTFVEDQRDDDSDSVTKVYAITRDALASSA